MSTTLAKIYQPAKTAMQSGKAKDFWLLEYVSSVPHTPEPLMGWNTMGDTKEQIKLKFETKEQAIAYAKAKNIPYEVLQPHIRKTPPKAYATNFANGRRRAYSDNA
ncbi:MAG: ETC complex I subunit [Rickettsiales bacterium]